jgi:hypothetical protein
VKSQTGDEAPKQMKLSYSRELKHRYMRNTIFYHLAMFLSLLFPTTAILVIFSWIAVAGYCIKLGGMFTSSVNACYFGHLLNIAMNLAMIIQAYKGI